MAELSLFWGKARQEKKDDQQTPSSPYPTHPLIAHMLDVAAVASYLPLSDECGIDKSTALTLVALHDIGKLSPEFQKKAPKTVNIAEFLEVPSQMNAAHDEVAMELFYSLCYKKSSLHSLLGQYEDEDFLDKAACFLDILNGVAGHHGAPVLLKKNNLDNDILARADYIVSLFLKIFKPKPIPSDIYKKDIIVQWKLAHLTILSDWIGSRVEWFPYVSAEDIRDPKKYYETIALPRAKEAVKKAGLIPAKVANFKGGQLFLNKTDVLSPVQSLCEAIDLPAGPCLVVIEDMTGSGKTEAALTVAHRMMAQGNGKGIYVALPTMATANAMYERLEKSYQSLFQEGEWPSLALAHSYARLYDKFSEAIAPEEQDGSKDNTVPGTAESHCTAWLGSESRRALLAQIGVGTIDQALKAALPVRYATVRQAGLAHKILLIDECHAFDDYMREELIGLLKYHASLGGSAILLSATLTMKLRTQLVEAFHKGLGLRGKELTSKKLTSTAYPLVTLANKNKSREIYCAPRSGLAREINLKRLGSEKDVTEILSQAAQKKAAICWIRNTVDDVIKAAQALRKAGENVIVFHARFAMIDRLDIEKQVIQKFGRKSKSEDRAAILIASQVVEQSLDLDFDLLCTDLAPMDLIIQRAGRLHRHERMTRPIDKAELFILSPEPVDEPEKNWIDKILPGTSAIYRDSALLWRTARALFRRGKLTLPEEMRDLIEEAGQRDIIPEALKENSYQSEGSAKAAASQGRHNLWSFDFGYVIDGAKWSRDTTIPTRLIEDHYIKLRLSFVKDGVVLPWAVRKDENLSKERFIQKAWALSEISVSQKQVASVTIPPHFKKAAVNARSRWTKWERKDEENFLLVILEEIKGEWVAKGKKKEKNKNVILTYNIFDGLNIIEDKPNY
ncbi:CRISPR-associated helicase Cas3' [Aristophania vespae]|uniref:CRISPR-associated helicase Cas3 n=2 Tax=Aristophania vespae TaxID=2697033 RepID=A0A6P1NL29_9PROT|nr:CRISPR-associated helicase Cas3' [Aristophania vespae]